MQLKSNEILFFTHQVGSDNKKKFSSQLKKGVKKRGGGRIREHTL